MAAFVSVDPDWNRLLRDLPKAASAVQSQAAQRSELGISGIFYMPFGVVSAFHPADSPLAIGIGADTFSPRLREALRIHEAVRGRRITFSGPQIINENAPLVIVSRYPVFIPDVDENESWSNPYNQTMPTDCPPGLCYNATSREKFWGFVATFLFADKFFFGENSRFNLLKENKFAFRLIRDGASLTPEERVIVEDGEIQDKDAAVIDVAVNGAEWSLHVYNPEIRRSREMAKGVTAMIVVVAVIVSGLLLLYLVSSKEAVQLYKQQMAANQELQMANDDLTKTKGVLEAEKLQREALLERQLKLIACFESGSSKKSKESMQGTMERIAEARGHINESKAHLEGEEEVQILELLGEGSFGKVHKGLWRGTIVAVKIMLLPANMSGAAKREKMVVWEAAISSSLSHPNIVQTYTYSIKPVKENDKQAEEGPELASLGSAIQFSKSAAAGANIGSNSTGQPQSPSPTAQSSGSALQSSIHGFQVQLLLEYCDKGTLRGALDQGVFMADTGLNYPAILDSAIDIARAMLHLHCNNVLHMDLKSRNVLLASSGSEEKGVSCKVADFGLAVRMEHTETHMSGMFQGTATHMAPEVLLEGRVSKAADVYAFGITMWELFTGATPYIGIPKALLGHKIAKERLRPSLPLLMPREYKAVLIRCWSHRAENRPTFAQVLEELQDMRAALHEPTPPLPPIHVPRKTSQSNKSNKLDLQLPKLGSKAAQQVKQWHSDTFKTRQESAESVCLPIPPQANTSHTLVTSDSLDMMYPAASTAHKQPPFIADL